jgi:hypothetical protein
VPYHENPTFFGAMRSHWRMLSRLGNGERAPAAVPSQPESLEQGPAVAGA